MTGLLLAIIYLAFISLGLPDSLLGSAWPVMHLELGASASYAGIISMIISIGTIVSSLQSDRLTRKLGVGRVTGMSVAMTAIALFGFSVSNSFWLLCLWAIPYGLGAGSVDAALNHFVALHYSSRHMSWLHCMWGIGATLGPYVMGFALSGGQSWKMGYRWIALIQIALTALLFVTLPLWRKNANATQEAQLSPTQVLSLPAIFRIAGAKEIMITFFCYCALEQTVSLWCSSYMAWQHGMSPEFAASFAGLFFLGITIGRAISGLIATALGDDHMVRLGAGIILLGVCTVMIPNSTQLAQAGFALIGLGCAPIYPSIIHATPARFGEQHSQAIIGVQMASAYVGTLAMPPLFGFLAQHVSVALFPWFLLLLLVSMFCMHERTIINVKKERGEQA